VVGCSRRGVAASGLSQRRYCRENRLTETTFTRWLKVIADVKALTIKRELDAEKRREARRKRNIPVHGQVKSRAVRAYWAMHIEALRWSGLTAYAYAKALRISEPSLKRWRTLIENDAVTEDWRSMLHPSTSANLSTSAKLGAKEPVAESVLTNAPTAPAKPTRRNFTAEEKLAIVLESERPGETVSSVARQHDLVTSVLFRWRAELGFSKDSRAKLATIRLTGSKPGSASESLVLQDLIPPPEGMSAVELEDGRRVFAPIGSDVQAVREQVARQEIAG